jgi:hypothetical protein
LGEFSDSLFFNFLRCKQGMLALRQVVATDTLQSLFGPFDFLSDTLRIEINRDGVVADRKRSERPEDPAPRPLRTAF